MPVPSAHIEAVLHDLHAGLDALYGERLVRLVLYGSHARGEATEESDVDVLAVLSGEVRPAAEIFQTSKLALDVGSEHDALVSIITVSEEAFEEKRYAFLRNVHAEGIPV